MAIKPTEYVEIEVDGKSVSVPKDEVLLWSLRDKGYDIPHFCAHKWLEPFAGCRMCLVDIEMGGRMMPKLQPSCAMKPAEGMKVFTENEKVIQNRREQIEFHLINHPLECPICDKGGECMLQDQVYDHGADEGRYSEEKRVREDKIITDYIRMNYKRCIQCKRCVHFCQDIDGSHRIKFVERGADTRIEGFPEAGVADRFSGNTIDMCPVGALTASSTRFFGRPWEQEYSPSIGSLDSVGANIHLCGRLGEMARIIPRDNPEVENGLIDDVTRFSWEHIDDPRRVTRAVINSGGETTEVSSAEGQQELAARLAGIIGEHGPESVGVIAGGGLNNEEYVALRRFCENTLNTSRFHFGDDLIDAGSVNATALHSLTNSHCSIEEILGCSTVFSIGCDLFEEAPALGLRIDTAARRGKLKLLSARSHGSECDRFAEINSYGFGNELGFIRGLTNALKGTGDVPKDCEPFVEVLKAVGEDLSIVYGSEIWQTADPAELIVALEDLKSAIGEVNPESSVYLCPVYPQVNSVGAMLVNWLDLFNGADTSRQAGWNTTAILKAASEGQLKYLIVLDTDLLNTHPDRELVKKAFSAVSGSAYIGQFATETAKLAAIQLPLGTFAHREGTVLSMEWRLQLRAKAEILSTGPSTVDIVNLLSSCMGKPRIAVTESELLQDLSSISADGIPTDLPPGGIRINVSAGQATQTATNEIPAEIRGTADEPLILVPKRFLYNDRQEIYFSPVFDTVDKPFACWINPNDLKIQNIDDGDTVVLGAAGKELEFEVRSAHWVRAGSVVINNYSINKPANLLAGCVPVPVSVKRKVEVGS